MIFSNSTVSGEESRMCFFNLLFDVSDSPCWKLSNSKIILFTITHTCKRNSWILQVDRRPMPLDLHLFRNCSLFVYVYVCKWPLTHHMCKVNVWPHTLRLSDSQSWRRSNTGAVIWFELGSVFVFHHKTSIKTSTTRCARSHTHSHAHTWSVSHDQGVFSVCVSVYVVFGTT